MPRESARSGECIWPAGADRANTVVGLDHVAIAGKQESGFAVSHHQQSFQMAQRTVRAPLFGKLDRGARQIAVKFLQLVFEPREKRQSVRSAAGKTGQNLVAEEAPDFFSVVLDHAFAERDLSVARHYHMTVFANAKHCRASYTLTLILNWHSAIITRRSAEAKSSGVPGSVSV